jgi:hypothetical protein
MKYIIHVFYCIFSFYWYIKNIITILHKVSSSEFIILFYSIPLVCAECDRSQELLLFLPVIHFFLPLLSLLLLNLFLCPVFNDAVITSFGLSVCLPLSNPLGRDRERNGDYIELYESELRLIKDVEESGGGNNYSSIWPLSYLTELVCDVK